MATFTNKKHKFEKLNLSKTDTMSTQPILPPEVETTLEEFARRHNGVFFFDIVRDASTRTRDSQCLYALFSKDMIDEALRVARKALADASRSEVACRSASECERKFVSGLGKTAVVYGERRSDCR